jgi:hypothetical protein
MPPNQQTQMSGTTFPACDLSPKQGSAPSCSQVGSLNRDVSGITVIHSQPSAEANDSVGAPLSS